MGSSITEKIYLISFDTSFQKEIETHQNLLESYVIKARIENLGANLVFIPPLGWVFLLGSKDIDNEKKMQRIKEALYEFLEIHSNGVIIFNGFNRIKEKKRLFLQSLSIDFLSLSDLSFPGIIAARNWDDVFLFLTRIAFREQVKDHIPDVGRQKSRKKLLADAQQFFIEGLTLCGSKKAQKLLKSFDNPIEIIESLLNSPDKIKSIKGFGENFVEKNHTLLNNHLKDD
ncbi:hypothetical protein NEF87_000998 [Candidatus Lokiarchaeum ossiferum]|uniref:ERCC4 domain-containing protein n=1 Tax=Candidatus Lokiarchaeum ossiferum TaxID=2951803 RepID=A0ABY6HMI0_9ARCH|nr:hypothetical protein NEF87_000998 [Candidatus Lokiarchaeum sp. B-35]